MSGRGGIALKLAALGACVLTVGFSTASFTDSSKNPQSVTAAADFVAPSATAGTIAKAEGGLAGYVRKGGAYYVYAKVTESGNPPSGIASVRADVSGISAGQTAVDLAAGSFAVGGASYDYRSPQLTAGASLAAGSRPYSLTLSDAAGNARAQAFAATIDNGPFAGSEIETANASGGTAGRAESGDTVSFVFSKAPDPGSIVAGWEGSGTRAVAVSIADGSSGTLSVSGAALGSVSLEGSYVSAGRTATFAGSSMSVSGARVTVVLGTDSSGSARTETSKSRPAWTPLGSAYDAAGNGCSTATVSGENARQF